jgi:putative PEP-CTERM system histidine kinase
VINIILSTIASLALLALGVYTLRKQRITVSASLSLVLLLLAGMEIIDQLALSPSFDPVVFKQISIYLESLLPGAFMLLSLTYARSIPLRALSPVWRTLAAVCILFPLSVLLLPASDFYYSPDLQRERVLFLEGAGYWFYVGVMLSCIIALVNIEATFSSTSGTDRWKMKFEATGIMSILSVLIFYYSQGLLYRTINMNLVPVRSGVLIIAAFFIGYSKLLRGNGVRIVVSRHIFYRSLALLIVGSYLFILGLLGEGMKYFDVSFDRDLTIFLAFAGGIMLLIILLSEKLRRRVKVYVNKHFFARKHDYGTEWLMFTGKLAACKTLEDVREAILSTFTGTFGLRGASLYLLEKGRYVRASNHSMPGGTNEVQISTALISYFMERGRVFSPLDKEYTPTAEEDSFIRRTGAKLILPLTGNGSIVGLVLFGEQLVREEFIYEDYDLMKVLARQAALSLINIRLSEELIETREMAAVARISSFVIHDLKNLSSTLSLIVDNAEEHIGNPDFQHDMIITIQKTLGKMRNLMQRLKSIPEKDALHAECKDLHLLSQEILGEFIKLRPGMNIAYDGNSAFSIVDGEEIKKVIVNLIQNALDAINGSGMVTVETGRNGADAYIRVSDNGCGMTEDFMKHHVCKPFRTTKEKGLGIGLYQCKQIVEAHNGTIRVESVFKKGSVVTVSLPGADMNSEVRR